ncbi:MAG: hypothetical protein GEU86_08990 [Actinophytocola sp.]|nr:hypothetical protein [Actinophytocola sp.]
MVARVIAHTADCPGGNCPTTYGHPRLPTGISVVQGYRVTDPVILADLNIPEGEDVVAVPDLLLVDHAREVQA